MNETSPTPPVGQTPQPANPASGPPSPLPFAQAPPTVDAAGPVAEETLWVGRTSWKHFMPRLSVWTLVGIAYLAAYAYFDGFTKWGYGWGVWPVVIFAAIVLGRLGWHILSRRYRLTQQRLFFERGILSQTINQTELIRVDDVRIRKNVIDRVFGLGTIDLMSTDITDKAVIIEGVNNADAVAETIRANVQRLRKKSVYVERL